MISRLLKLAVSKIETSRTSDLLETTGTVAIPGVRGSKRPRLAHSQRSVIRWRHDHESGCKAFHKSAVCVSCGVYSTYHDALKGGVAPDEVRLIKEHSQTPSQAWIISPACSYPQQSRSVLIVYRQNLPDSSQQEHSSASKLLIMYTSSN